MKTCRRCRADLPASAFRADSRQRDGLASWCKQCHRERSSEWARENRAKLSAKAAQFRAENPELVRDANARFKLRHRDRLATAHAQWARDNADKRRASTARRKAAKLRATPAWADKSAIAAVYAEAARIQRETGERHHVDHIVPLQSPKVCGLHCEANLQIIRGPENEGKRNRWWPDMFDDAQRQGTLFGVEAA